VTDDKFFEKVPKTVTKTALTKKLKAD